MGRFRPKGKGHAVSSVFLGEADPDPTLRQPCDEMLMYKEDDAERTPRGSTEEPYVSPWEASPPAVEPSEGVRPLVPASRS